MLKIMMITVLLTGALLLLSACSKSVTPALTPTQKPTSPSNSNEVRIPGRIFEPGAITVTVGTTVTWFDDDAESTHTVTSDTGLFNATLSRGHSFSYTFTERGTFSYYCQIHSPYGMSGTVFVQ